MPYLADSSIWGWANSGRRPDIAGKLTDRIERGDVVTCGPVVLEVMHRARTGGEYEHLIALLFDPLPWLPLTAETTERAVAVQRSLASTTHGSHLRPAIDFLVAATAEAAGAKVTLWALDRDLRVICAHTGQPFEDER